MDVTAAMRARVLTMVFPPIAPSIGAEAWSMVKFERLYAF
jgi:hypothetical protein